MQWIDRYIYAVTRELPEAQREDIKKELRGLIEDMLDERTKGAHRTEKDVESVLLELGNPRELADKYREHKRYLIGPEVFPFYLSVLKVVFMGVSIAMTVLFIIQMVSAPDQIGKNLIGVLGAYVGACFQGFTWVTIVFAAIDYFGIRDSSMGLNEVGQWKLSELPEVPDVHNQIPRAEPIAGIIFTVIFGVLLTFSIRLLGIWYYEDGRFVSVVTFLSEAVFRDYLPLVWASLSLSIILEIFQLVTGKWTMKLVGFEFLGHVVNLVIGLIIFSNSSIWNPNFMQQMVQSGMFPAGSDAFHLVSRYWTLVTGNFVYLIGAVFILELISSTIKVLKMRNILS